MSQERREQLAQQLTDELRGLEDRQIQRIGRIWDEALRTTIRRVMDRLDRIEAQPEYDPKTTPGAFLGSTPDGPAPIEPVEKNQASLYLEGQLIQDLRQVLSQMPLTPEQELRLEEELSALLDRAQDLGTEYAIQLTQDNLKPALQAINRPPDDPVLQQWPDRERERYQEGQRFTRLFDMAGSVAAAERDFRSLAMNYLRARELATDAHVAASKHYYYKWWRRWGDEVSFVVAREMAAGPDPRRVKRELQQRIPNINEAFKGRAETIARTETLMASGEAQERTYRKLRVGFVQYLATLDDRTCEFCAPRHGSLYWIGSVKAPIHPNCVLPDTPVLPGQLVTAQRVRYSGPIVTIRTARGHRLSCTENHLVATSRGWVPAHLIQKGDQVLSQPVGHQGALAAYPDLDDVPATIKEVFETALAASGMAPVSVPVASMHLHGDGKHGQGQIEVVTPNRELMDWIETLLTQQLRDLKLIAGDAMATPVAGLSTLDLNLLGIHAALAGLVGSHDLALPLLRGHLSPLEQLSFLARAWRDPHFSEPTTNHLSGNPELLGQAINACSRLIGVDDVIDVDVDASCHERLVYDLTTLSGTYFAGGMLTHNCRCTTTPVTLESLALQNALADDDKGTWEAEAQAQAGAVQRHFEDANGEGASMRPIGGPGQARGPRDFPLMERTGLPQTKPRPGMPVDDPRNGGSRPWPSGDPVWCPRRGWLDPNARAAYEAIRSEVAEL